MTPVHRPTCATLQPSKSQCFSDLLTPLLYHLRYFFREQVETMLFLDVLVRSKVGRPYKYDGDDELALLGKSIPEEKLRERDLVRLPILFFALNCGEWRFCDIIFHFGQTLGMLLNR